MDNDNKRKVVLGYEVLIWTVLIFIIIRLLFIAKVVRISNEYDGVEQGFYSSETIMLLWNVLPFLIMWIDLLWQQRSLRKAHITSIDTRPLIIASIIGAIFYFLIDTSRSIGFAIIPVRFFMPFLLLAGYCSLKAGFLEKDKRRK